MTSSKQTRVDELGLNINDETPYLNHAGRLESLWATQLLDSSIEERFERLTRMASALLDAPLALISFLSDEEQFIKSACVAENCVALESASMLALEYSLCQHVVASQGVLRVDDLRAKRTLQRHPALSLGISAYLGVPLFAPDGHVLGSLCVMDTDIHPWQDEDVSKLADLAALVMQEMFLGRSVQTLGDMSEAPKPSFSQDLSQNELQFKLALDAAEMGTWVWDIASGGVSFDEHNYPLWELSKDENVTFEKVMTQLHPEDKAGLEHALEDALADKAPYNYSFRIMPKGGGERWLAGRGKVIKNEAGQPVKMLGVNYDISSQKRAEQALHELNESLEARIRERTAELEASNQDLAQFAYIASHDLQEPLRMVASYVQLLEKRYSDKLDDDAREFIHFAADGAKRMQQLIQDLLAFSRVQTHARSPSLISSEAALEKALKNLRLQLKETGADIQVGTLPEVHADPAQLSQLFQNLIGNALKFCSQTPRIRVNAEESPTSWRISVEDNGIGMTTQDAKKIFDPFSRLHTREEFAGNGIGLAICQRIAERHGGKLWVHSTPKVGSVFYVELPKTPQA